MMASALPCPAQLKANIVALSKSKFGHHVVCKLVSTAPKEDVAGKGDRFHRFGSPGTKV